MDQEKAPQFVVDSMLGRLARWLRILGFDTWYFREIGDRELLQLHEGTGRILLTRDTRLVRFRGIGRHVLVKNDGWEDQLREVIGVLSLSVCYDRILTRCGVCNGTLEKLALEEAYGRIPDYVAASASVLHGCRSCGKIYWAGTHRKRVAEVVARLGFHPNDGREPPVG